MSGNIKQLTQLGQDIYPVTHSDAVVGLEDLQEIREGAAEGATAYQKPSGGIPSTDLASGVIPTVNNATLTVKMNSASKGTFTANAGTDVEIDLGTVITSHQDISGKADKVSNATNGNLAGLDSTGNLTDSTFSFESVAPTGYKRLDWLRSDRNQWINTGLDGTSDLEIEMVFSNTKYGQYGHIYGNYVDENHNVYRLLFSTNDNTFLVSVNTRAGSGNTSISGVTLGNKHTIIVNSSHIYMDGTQYNSPTAQGTANTGKIAIFSRNTTGPALDTGTTIYSFIARRNGTEVLHLVPMLRISDSKPGMYDTLTGNFLTNIGSGEFTYSDAMAGYALKENGVAVNVVTNVDNVTGLAAVGKTNDFDDLSNKPTTLSGYGITDAKIESGTITLGNDTITPITSHQDISGKEDKSNKVTAFQTTPDDTHYPSEKLTKDSLDAKQNQLYYDNVIGRMYRNNVSGGGNISINGTSGQFPTVTTAGTYTVEVKMTSATASYGLNVTFGSNTYNLTTTNGTITDSRDLTIAANSTWSAAVVGSVANGTTIEVRIVGASVKVTTIGKTAVTNSYNDLFDKPSIPSISGLESTSNKVSTLTGYETNTTKYPNTKAVHDAIAALPSPMVFQGTIGTSGTSTTVPSNPTEGDTYKIIEGGTSLYFPGISGTIKVGDTVIYKNSTTGWILIPSGDEPSGTVTSVAAGAGLNTTSDDTTTDGGTISSSGTLYLTKSGVTAGTYQGITVDKYGRVTTASDQGYGTYSKPSGGIPETDLSQAVSDKLNATEVFWATYGTTTIAEVRAAISAGKFVVVYYDGYVYVNNYYDSVDSPGADSYYFSCLAADEPIGYWLVLDSNGWTNDSFTLENANHRVSSWQSTPDNQHYPSEKLVKDSLDGKQATLVGSGTGQNIKTVNNTSLLGSGNIDAEDIYWATYGTTTFAELTTAWNDGKQILCFWSNRVYNLIYVGASFTFGYVWGSTTYRLACSSSSVWSNTSDSNQSQITVTGLLKGNGSGSVTAAVAGTDYQAPLVSGTNIKTINNQSILGEGNITVTAGDTNAVKYVEQSLTSEQQAQARTNIGAGTYSKPSGGIPSTDIASGVIPDVSNFITKSVNDLLNYYLKSETYTQTEVNNLIGAIQQFHYEIAASTSAVTSPASNVLYLIGPTGSGADKYEEYVYPDSTTGWVKIGDTSIDLSGYVTTSALNTALADYTTTTDLTTLLGGKADKVTSATSGNFAGLDGNGNLTDSGSKASDFLTQHQDISGKQDTPLETTWSALKSLRDGGTLEAGRLYRITDYVATTTQTDTQSANHPFDIIVRALTNNKLSEEANAALHSGDTYFSSSKLEAWSLRYCIDNDTTRFSWADSTNGKGVIYRMIDEYGNDVPYDFKGIQFKRYEIASTSFAGFNDLVGLPIGLSGYQKLSINSSSSKWYYTFSTLGSAWADDVTDASLNAMAANVVFTNPRESNPYSLKRTLSNNVFAYGPIAFTFFHTKDGDTSSTYSAQTFASDLRFEGCGCVNNTFIGWAGIASTKSTFRRNLILGSFRHIRVETNMQDNAIFNWNDFAYINIEHGFQYNVFSIKKVASVTFEQYFDTNTISGTQLFHVKFGKLFGQNTISNTYMHSCSFNEQTNNNTFNGDFRACTFTAYVSYTDFTGGTYGTNIFYGVDFQGCARGASNSRIAINNSNFLVPAATGVKRRITIQGDTNGNLVATWYSEGKRVGITKTASASTWTAIPDLDSKQDTIDSSHKLDYSLIDNTPAIHNVPSGGTSGYVLAKASGTDYDLEWVAQSGGSLTPMTNAEIDSAVNSAWV